VRKASWLLVALLVSLVAFPAAALAQGALAVVYDVGGRGDLSFNDMAALGADRAARELGVRVTEVESATTGDFLPNLRALARSRQYDVIVGVGFLIEDAMRQVAEEFPNQKFALIDGFVDAPNVMSISFADHEGSALVGVVAAITTLEAGGDTVGIVLGIEIPILLRFEIGFRAGVRWAVDRYNEIHGTNKQLRILHAYTGAFDDPARGKTAAEAMLGQGATVVYQVAGATGLGALEAVESFARAQGKTVGPPFAIGVDSAQDWIHPGFIAVSMVKRVDNGVFEAIKRALDGTFQGGAVTLKLAEGGVAASTIEMVDAFFDEAIELGQKTPEEKAATMAGVRAARAAVPQLAWDLLNELDGLIRSGEYVVPEALDRNTAEYWREVLSTY